MGTVYRRDGERRWSIAWRDENGRRLSKRSSKDKRVATEELRQMEDRAERLKLGMPVAGAVVQKLFAEALDAYERQLTAIGRTASTITELVQRIERVAAACHWRQIGQITAAGVSEYLASQAGRLAPTTRNLLRGGLRAFCAYLVSQEWLPSNPIVHVARASVGRPGDPTHRPRARRAFTVDEFERLSAVDGTGHRGIDLKRRYLYRVAGLSGLRISELRALERQDYTLGSSPLWHLRPHISKSKRRDVVPMLPECAVHMAQLSADKRPTDRVFPWCGHETTFAMDLERARIPKRDHTGRQVDFHALRYSFCTFCAKVLPIQTVMRLMRHASISLTANLYDDLGLVDMAEQVAKLPPILGRAKKSG